MILLIGAGAVGTVLAGHILKAGREPLRIYARPKDAAAFAGANELRISYSAPGRPEFAVAKPELASSLDLIGVDYLLLCVKFGALEKLLSELPPIPPGCTLVSTLNGIRALPLIRAKLPGARVLPMTIMFNAQLPAPLHGQLTTRPIIIVGGGDKRLLECVKGTPMRVQRGQGEPSVWGKLLINLANAIGAITHTTFKDLFTQPELRQIYVKLLDESIGLLERAGIPYQLPLPIPYRRYRWVLLNGGPVTWWVAKLKNDLQDGAYASMVSDVEQGRLTEVDQLNGEIVALGVEHGVATPVNARIVALIQSLQGKTPPPYLTPAELLRQLA